MCVCLACRCIDGKSLQVPDIKSLVQQAEGTIITMSGPGKIEHPEMYYKIFTNLEMNAENKKEAEEKVKVSVKQRQGKIIDFSRKP